MSVGGSAQKSSQKGSSSGSNTFDSYTTPIVPGFIENDDRDYNARINQWMDRDASSLVSGPNDGQNAAYNSLVGMLTGGGIADQYNASTGVASGVANRSSDYASPFRDQVLNSATANWDDTAGKTRAQQSLALARNGAFGGSGAAITQSETEKELALGRSSEISGLLKDMFDKSSQYGLQSDALKLQAGNQMASNASGFANTQAGLASGAFDIGEQLRQIQNEQAQAPLTLLDSLINMRGNLDLSKYLGQRETGTGTEVGTSKGSGTSFGANASYKFT